jgi:hypothetical protein
MAPTVGIFADSLSRLLSTVVLCAAGISIFFHAKGGVCKQVNKQVYGYEQKFNKTVL